MQISFARIIGYVSAAIIIAAPVVASAYALNDPALIPVLQLMQQRLHTVSLSATSTAEREARSIFYGGFLIYDHVHEGLTDAEMGDDAITRLQTFLARDRVVYPEGRVTGIFDIATKDAVTLFQVTCHHIR